MPEVLRIRGFRFFFFQPRGSRTQAYSRSTSRALRQILARGPLVALVESRGFRGSELRELHSLIEDHQENFKTAWDEHFDQ